VPWIKNVKKRFYICGKAHVQSQWKGANFDPHDIKIPYIFFKFELDDRDYAPEVYTSANLIFISIR